MILYIFLGFLLCHFSIQKVSASQTKRRGTLLTIFRPPRIFQPTRLLYFTQISNPPAYQNLPVYSGPQSKLENFTIIINEVQPLHIIANFSILDVSSGPDSSTYSLYEYHVIMGIRGCINNQDLTSTYSSRFSASKYRKVNFTYF